MPSLTPPEYKNRSKFGSAALPAIFLGYNIQAGAKWTGEFYAITLDDLIRFRRDPKHRFHIHRTKECFRDDRNAPFSFPAYKPREVPPAHKGQPVAVGDGAAEVEA